MQLEGAYGCVNIRSQKCISSQPEPGAAIRIGGTAHLEEVKADALNLIIKFIKLHA